MKLLSEVKEETKYTYKTLKNKMSHKSLEFYFRPFEPKDAPHITEIVKEEYGNTYFKAYYYDPDQIIKKVADHIFDLFVFVDRSTGKIAAMEMFSYFTEDGDDYIETASQIIHKDYRGYGLATAMVVYLLEIAKEMNPAGFFMHGVTFHTVSQVIYVKLGMIPTGFRFGSFLTEKMENSYPLGKCSKYSEGITILPINKKDAGKLYVPDELIDFTNKIYKRMGVTYEIAGHEEVSKGGLTATESELIVTKDSEQKFMGVHVKTIGQDLPQRLTELIDSIANEESWVIQLTLNIDTYEILKIYDKLKEIRFFFTGLKPLCGQHERMYMQWIGNINLMVDEYALTGRYREIVDDLRKISPDYSI